MNDELALLKSMWGEKVSRETQLIIPSIVDKNKNGESNDSHWKYRVGYAFRDALDIKYEQRKKNKKPYMIWTQGPILSFKEGDLLFTSCGLYAVQVKYADSMGWDVAKAVMYQGSVTFDEFDFIAGTWSKIKTNTLTQMEFLEMLIYGKNS